MSLFRSLSSQCRMLLLPFWTSKLTPPLCLASGHRPIVVLIAASPALGPILAPLVLTPSTTGAAPSFFSFSHCYQWLSTAIQSPTNPLWYRQPLRQVFLAVVDLLSPATSVVVAAFVVSDLCCLVGRFPFIGGYPWPLLLLFFSNKNRRPYRAI